MKAHKTRIGGEIRNTRMSVIHEIVLTLFNPQQVRLKSSEDLFIETEQMDINIYEGKEAESGYLYLVGGFMYMPLEEAGQNLLRIGKALEQKNISYLFSYSDETLDDAPEEEISFESR